MKIQISARRIATKRRRGFNRYRYVPIWSGEFPQFKVPSMEKFAKWLSDRFGAGSILYWGTGKTVVNGTNCSITLLMITTMRSRGGVY